MHLGSILCVRGATGVLLASISVASLRLIVSHTVDDASGSVSAWIKVHSDSVEQAQLRCGVSHIGRSSRS